MNNYYALIYLTDHINTKLQGGVFLSSCSPHKNVWEGIFEIPGEEATRLVYSTRPGETALFTDRYRAPRKRNTLHFFETLGGGRFERAQLSENDRLLTLRFRDGRSLLFMPFGNSPNLFLVEDGMIVESFRKPRQWAGKPAPEPRAAQHAAPPPANSSPASLLTHFDRKLPRHLIPMMVQQSGLERVEPGPGRQLQAEAVVRKMTEAMRSNPEFRVLQNGHLCLIPDSLLPAENDRVFESVNDAVRHAFRNLSMARRYTGHRQRMIEQIDRALKRCRHALQQLESAEIALDRASKYESFGHILMASAHRKPEPGRDSIVLENFYDENRPVQIPIRPEIGMAANAEAYYNRAAKARRRVEQSARRKRELDQELEKLTRLRAGLLQQQNLSSLTEWERMHSVELRTLRAGPNPNDQRSSPWKSLMVKGYEIRIGKNAKSNDRLTRAAHKEDFWLHARGSGGSHVIVRMENDRNAPPRDVLQRAAGYAAWHSAQRGAGLVPVSVTRRKYVTKPKGGAPGAVRITREEVIMAAPTEPGKTEIES